MELGDEEEESFRMMRKRERRQEYIRDYAEEYCNKTAYGELVIQQRLCMVHWITEDLPSEVNAFLETLQSYHPSNLFRTSPIMSWTFSLWLLLLFSSFFSSINTTIVDEKRKRITAQHGAVATDHGQCSIIGKNILQQGGHAVDAVVAAALYLGVVSPASSGIGGGAFMLLRSTECKTEAYDMRETAPKLASQYNLLKC